MNGLRTGFSALGRRLAVVAGALVGLTSLLVHAPVWVATARGAGTTFAILFVVRTAGGFLARPAEAGSGPKS